MKSTKNPKPTRAGYSVSLMLSTFVFLLLVGCSSDDDNVTDTSPLFVGNYSVKDVSDYSGHEYNYEVSITKSGVGTVKISNFADILNVPVTASVSGMNFTIAPQTFTNPSGKQITVSASGSLQDNVLTFSYTTLGYLDYTGQCQAVRNN